jgi:two-component sensor histidine kinase
LNTSTAYFCQEGSLATTASRKCNLPGSDLLLAEVLHRINNDLGAVVSIMSRAAARSDNDELKAMLGTLTERIMACTFLNRALRMPSESNRIDASAYMREICEAISRSKLGDNRIRLAFFDRALEMNSITCWRLGLIVCALVNDSIRHAFDRMGGVIRVELLAYDSSVEGRVSETGQAGNPIRPRRGLKIVECIVGTLGGSIVYLTGERGSAVVIILPRCPSPEAVIPPAIDVSPVVLQ